MYSSKEPSESTTVTVGDVPFGLGFFWMMRSMSSWYYGGTSHSSSGLALSRMQFSTFTRDMSAASSMQ